MTRISTFALPLLALSQVASQRDPNTPMGINRTPIDDFDHDDWHFENSVCKSEHQSPINFFVQNISDIEVWNINNPPVQFGGDCDESVVKKLNNLFKWEIQDDQKCIAKSTNDMREYSLVDFYLHLPSEHTVNNQRYDAELQFIHKAMDGSNKHLVVGVFLQATNVAQPNVFVQNLLKSMENGSSNMGGNSIKYAEMLSNFVKTTHLLNYSGSLTTPGCSDDVDWWVLLNPFAISPAELQSLKALYAMLPEQSNIRPLQPLNKHDVVYFFNQGSL